MIDLNDVRPLGSEPARYDLDAVVAGLRATAASWVPQHFAGGRRNGDEWRLANIRGDAPRKNGSCVITLKGEHAGDWIDFDTNDGGGPLSALEHATGLSGRALIEYAAELAGSAPVRSTSAPASKDRGKDARHEIELILSRCQPIAGTPAAAYLAVRGLDVPHAPDLLFHPDLTYWETRTGYPALVAVVRNASGEAVAIHRTYLAPDGTGKADVPKPRMMLGPVSRGAVRLGPIGENGVLGLAEGIETALSAMQARPELPVWAALSAGNLEQVALPLEAVRVVILADNDGAGTGIKAAERAAARFRAEGRRVWIAAPPREGEDDIGWLKTDNIIAAPPREGEDFNDLLRREGPEAVREAVDAAVEWTPATPPEVEMPEPSEVEVGGHQPVGFRAPAAPLPQMRADDGNLARLTERSWNLLQASNAPPWLFRCGGRPSWVERDDEGRPVAHPMTEDRVRHALTLLADWRRTSRTGDLVPAHPPPAVVKNLLATPDPVLPVLAAIVTAPVFGKDGSLLTEPGYHPATRLLYESPPRFALAAVPERPTPNEIAEARSLLLDDLLGDFPFTSEAERAHALALLLLPFVRTLVDGQTPLHLIEKPAPGTGATLMVDAIAIVTTSANASVMVEGRDDEEWRKRLTAKLRQIPSVVLIDNLRRRLDASSVAAALTAPYWEDRILGKSETTRFPIRCVWIATGNNPQFSNELARRLVRIRLDAHVDQPWRRDDFRHSNLLAWVRANRARLVAACLTLGRAWIAAGKPRHAHTLGSFEAWAEVMGGILEVAGVPGFLANLDEMYEAADAEGAVWRTFVGLWWDRHGTGEVSTKDLHEVALACEPPLPLGTGTEHSQRIRLGKALGRMRDRVFALGDLKVRIKAIGVRHQAQRWKLDLENEGLEEHSRHSPMAATGGECLAVEEQYSHPHSHRKTVPDQSVGEDGECGECFFAPYARADARAPPRDGERRKTLPTFPTLPFP